MTAPERAAEGAAFDGDHGSLRAAVRPEVDVLDGPERAEGILEIGAARGSLRALTASWEDVQRTRLALEQRLDWSGDLERLEALLARRIAREMRRHPVWPFLEGLPGLRGVHVARLVALIDDPHRFPGRVCEAGHHHPATESCSEIEPGTGCGVELADGTTCTANVGPVRRGTGTRALWHYLGLHVVDGRSPRKAKGKKVDWNPIGRTLVLMPGGIAEQIVRQRVPVYREIYDRTKERLIRERVGGQAEIDLHVGALTDGPEVEGSCASASARGLRLIQAEGIARKVAAKSFVADLLAYWKAVT